MELTFTIFSNRQPVSYCKLLLSLLLVVSCFCPTQNFAANDCPTGTDLIASYTWNGTNYELTSGTDDLIYILDGASQDSLNWSSVIGVLGVCINGANADDAQNFDFNHFVGNTYASATTGGIESISFCKNPEEALCKKDVLYGMTYGGGLYALSFTEAYEEGIPFSSINELDIDGSAAIGVVPTSDSLYYITLLDDNHEFHCFSLTTGVDTYIGDIDAPVDADAINFVRLTVDDNGNIYAIQGGNQTLYFIDPTNVTNGFVNSTNLTIGGDTLGNYGDLAFDIDGNLWSISENGLYIVSQDPNGNWVATFICDPGISNGNGIAIKPDGVGFITDSSTPISQIYTFDINTYFSGGDLCSTVQLVGEVDNPGEGDDNGTRIFDLTTYNAQVAISCDVSCTDDDGNRTVDVKAVGGFDESYTLTVTDDAGTAMPITNTGTINNFSFSVPADGAGYELFLTDAGACSVGKNITIATPIDITHDLSCNADGTKNLSVDIMGGNPPYLFSLDGGVTFNPVPSPFIINNIATSTIEITVSDNAQCIASASIGTETTTCNDNLDCTEDSFDAAACECVFTPIASAAASCDDGLDCTTDTFDYTTCTCTNETTGSGTQSCDDGLECTEDYFDENTCGCVNLPVATFAAACDDGLDCTLDAYDYTNCTCTNIEDPNYELGIDWVIEDVYACSGDYLDLNNYFTYVTTPLIWEEVVNGNTIVDIDNPSNILLETETACESRIATYQAFYNDVIDGCPIIIEATVYVHIYPAIAYDIVENNEDCTIEIVGHCDYFWINWITSENKPGNGPLFTADEGETGLVEFTIYNPETTTMGIPFYCQISTASIPYNCSISCEGVNCDDGLDCTTDILNEETCECSNTPITDLATSCDDGLDCTTDTYDYATCACENTPITDLANSCDDGLDCTNDTYNYTTCACENTPIDEGSANCDDGLPCTIDSYDVTTCGCIHTENPNYFPILTWQTYDVFVCSGTSVDLNSYITDNNESLTWQDVNAGTIVADPTNVLVETTCENGIIVYQAFYPSFDEGGCAITVEARIVFDIYPALSFDVIENDCSVEIINYCQNFEISWTANGTTGNGAIYTANEGESGSVEFTISNPAATAAPIECQQTTTEAIAYDCPMMTTCTQLINPVCNPTAVCAGESVSLSVDVINDDGGTLIWYDNNSMIVENPDNVVLTTDLCEGEAAKFHAVYLPANTDCDTLGAFTNETLIFPAITYTTVATDCSVEVQDVCENFTINWEDNLGNIGTGANYAAPEGSAGEVTFTVAFPSIFAPDACQESSFTESFSCNVVCGDYDICTGPITPILICPTFCNLESGNYLLAELHSTFDCSLTYETEECFQYIPLPGMELVEQDLLTVIACTYDFTVCDTVYITAFISENCDAEIIAEDDMANTDCESVEIDVLANDEGYLLEICGVNIDPALGTADITNAGILYTPANGYAGNAVFTYTVCDFYGNSTEANVSVFVDGPTYNGIIGTPDFAETYSQQITLDVLANDADGAYICGVGTSENGTVVEDNGVLLFMPAIDFVGDAQFTYDACIETNCGTVSSTVNVTVTVYPPACDNEPIEECAKPLTHQVLCPEFCLFDGSYNIDPNYSITSITSFFTICSVSQVEDQCFRYIPVPSFELFPDLKDTITVVGCNVAGICDTVQYFVQVSTECGEEEGEEGFKPITEQNVRDDRDGSMPAIAERIDESEIENWSVELYPNPSNGVFAVNVLENWDKAQTLNIYNVTGQLIKQIDVPANNTDGSILVDLSTQPKGAYFLQWNAQNHTKVESFIIY